MKSSILNTQNVFTRSLVVSLFLHFLVFNLFTFRFPARQWHPQPIFSFLGSILQEHDLQSAFGYPKTIRKISADHLDWTPQAPKNILPSHKIVTKPPFVSDIEGEEKTFMKSTFAVQRSTSEKKETDKILGIDTTAPTHFPLRLYQNDQN